MGSSPRGIVLYGIQLEREAEQPWDAGHEGDEKSWWRDVSGFVSSIESPYNDEGNYKPGYSEHDPRIAAYLDEEVEWDNDHPFPYELRRIGYVADPSHILSIYNMDLTAEWDECIELTPDMLVHHDEWSKQMIEFCHQYGIKTTGMPAWWLTSFYG